MRTLSNLRKIYYEHLYFYGKTCDSVTTFYKNCSYLKIRAEKNIIERMKNEKGVGYRVLNGNTYHFTCAYLAFDKKDGTAILVVDTAENTYRIKL